MRTARVARGALSPAPLSSHASLSHQKTNPNPAGTDPAVRAAIATVRAAAAGGADRPRPADLLAAILALEKAKLPPGPFFEAITGGAAAAKSGGRRWRLTFTAGAAAVQAASKGQREGAGLLGGGAGVYVPITAVQRWAAGEGGSGGSAGQQTGAIENGIYLGWLGALAFRGAFSLEGRRLPFALDAARVRVGPKWFEFPFKAGSSGTNGRPAGAGPFFLVAYVDDAVVVARGRSGGVAVWARAGEEWCARAGVDA